MTQAARVRMVWHCAARPFPSLPKARIEKTRAPDAQITEQHRVRKLAGEVQAAARAARERQGLTRWLGRTALRAQAGKVSASGGAGGG
jgi:hypothetical protein